MRPMGATTTQPTAQTAPHHLRLAAFWAALGGLGAATVLPYALALNPSVAARVPLPWPALAAAQGVQAGLLLLPLCWSGLRLGQPLGLDSPLARALVYHRPSPGVSQRGALVALATGIVGGGAIMLLDRVFAPLMPPAPQLAVSGIPLWQRALAVLYGGITEELLLRLFLMTLLAWLLWKWAQHGRARPASWVYWTAALLAAVLFGAGHLPTVAGIWPLTPMVVTRTLLLNGLPGVAFGLCYWRWGLEYAMLAHACADVAIHGIGGS